MARRKGSSRTKLRIGAVLLLIAMIGGGWAWWHLHHWQPERAAYAMQGVEIGAQDAEGGEVDWRAIKAIGANFAYLDASASAFARDSRFSANLEGARAAKLQVGAVHRYDPCQPAEKQAANFVTVVPREAALLPPAVDLDMLGDNCLIAVSDAAIESELTTFLNQVETHAGKPAILKVGKAFEERYHMASRIDRNLWLTNDRFEPDYAGRPWTLWTANRELMNEAGGAPVRWVVVQQ
jgi:lysozyme